MSVNSIGFSHYPESIRTELPVSDRTLSRMLEDTALQYPEHEAVSFYGNKMSYRELREAVNVFASALQQKGVQKGDRVALMLPNCPQYVIAYYGILTIGGIVTQVNPMLVERELQYLLDNSGARAMVVLDALYPKVKAVQGQSQLADIIVVSLHPSGAAFDPDESFEQWMALGTGQVEPVPIDPLQDVAVLQYTGGTTGRSKGAMLTHSNIVMNAEQMKEYYKAVIKVGRERFLTVIPLFHVYGMSVCMNFSVSTASSLILLPRFDLEEVLSTIQSEKPTTFNAVPTMYVAITHHPKAEEYGLDSIKLCVSGSAPMPVELMREFELKTGAAIIEGYGLTEASPVTHSNPPFAQRKPGSIGIGIPSTDYKIVDLAEGESELPPGELGELIVKGPQVMKGYWNMPEETAAVLRDGWLYTGDIARMDEEGYVYIVDRKKDLIIAGGFNIYPRDVEEVLFEHPAVQEAVVIGVKDEYRGETVKAVLVLKAGMSASEAEIVEFCRSHMASYKVPRIVEFRAQLPKTNVGKILRRMLREEANE